MVALTAAPIALAMVIAAISILSRGISPGSAFHFSLSRLPVYGYLGGGLLLLTGWLASRHRGVGKPDALEALALGWAVGLALILMTRRLGGHRAASDAVARRT